VLLASGAPTAWIFAACDRTHNCESVWEGTLRVSVGNHGPVRVPQRGFKCGGECGVGESGGVGEAIDPGAACSRGSVGGGAGLARGGGTALGEGVGATPRFRFVAGAWRCRVIDFFTLLTPQIARSAVLPELHSPIYSRR